MNLKEYRALSKPHKHLAKGRPPRQLEHNIQVAVITTCRKLELKYPELRCLLAIPNGGARHITVARKLKAEGVRPGVPDLFLPLPIRGYCAGMWIEMKSPDGKVSANQKDFMELMQWAGFKAIVCYSAQDAVDAIIAYMERYRTAKTTKELSNDLVFLRKQSNQA